MILFRIGAREIAMSVIIVLMTAALTSSASIAEELLNINIGVLTDMSGLYKDLGGEGSAVAAQMAVEDFGGKVLGRPVQVLAGDHKHKIDVATGIVGPWFHDQHVGMIVDMPNSAIALAMQKLAATENRISVAVSAGAAELTGKACTGTGFHWAYDTYSNTVGLARAMVGFGQNTWYFLTADYAFGLSLERDASRTVEQAGGKVLGRSLHPLNAPDFSQYLEAAQDSGARVIALANAGGDTVNSIKQAAEIGISARSQTLTPLLMYISDVHSLGLEIAKGLTFVDGFYWDADDASREWARRFYAKRSVMPTMTHAGVYSSVRHYLRAVQAAGTDNSAVVAAKMRELRVDDFFAKDGEVRADGRMTHDMFLVQVRRPEEARYPWDYYKILFTIPASQAFRPLAESECSFASR
jgi:branched-chain amino acid transport system substrate-binding protein